MHDDELPTDAALIRRLLVAQFPQWADLTIEPVRGEGTDNAMYRLGDALAVRAPRRPGAVAGIEREQAWLPRLAPLLPLPLPLPAAMGAPGEGYPWPWSVCRWLEGETLAPEWADARLAADLAGFIRSLQAVDASEAPRGFNQGRGAPLSRWRATIAERLGWLADLHNIGAITAAWEADAAAPAWAGEPVWLHGDLSAGNLLARDGRLAGVIDWGLLGAGDPACELQVGLEPVRPRQPRGLPRRHGGRCRDLDTRARLGPGTGGAERLRLSPTQPGDRRSRLARHRGCAGRPRRADFSRAAVRSGRVRGLSPHGRRNACKIRSGSGRGLCAGDGRVRGGAGAAVARL